MDNSPPPSQPISNIEDTFCGVPTIEDLTNKDSAWFIDLQGRGYVTNGRLTKKGKNLFRKEVRADWVDRDSVTAHDDFKLVKSVVDNKSLDLPYQRSVNLLHRDFCLLSAFTKNLKLNFQRARDQENLTELENAERKCKQAYQKSYNHLQDEGRLIRNPTWDQDYRSNTLDLATAANELCTLVTKADRNTRVADGEYPGQSSTLLAQDLERTFPTQSQTTGTALLSDPFDSAAFAAGSHHYEDHSSSYESLQLAATLEPARTRTAGVFGGFTVPDNTGKLLSRKKYGDVDAEEGSKSGDGSGFAGPLGRSLRGTIRKFNTP